MRISTCVTLVSLSNNDAVTKITYIFLCEKVEFSQQTANGSGLSVAGQCPHSGQRKMTLETNIMRSRWNVKISNIETMPLTA